MNFYGCQGSEVIRRVGPANGSHYRLHLGVIQGFSLDPVGEMAKDAEHPSIWEVADTSLVETSPLDEGWPKAKGEFFAYGACYAPSLDSRMQPVSASVRIGTVVKRLAVFGDRSMSALGSVSEPAAFSRIALTPQNAFGGEAFADNPLGKGMSVSTPDGLTPLPNVELPGSLLVAAGDRPMPAGFWSLAADAPRRVRHLGAFDERWLKQRWPHLPVDTHEDYFQLAPEDQRTMGPFRGGEPIEIQNMHPSRALIQARLPQQVCRVLVAHGTGAQTHQIAEYATVVDTVWLFPDALMGYVLYRCTVPVEDADAADVSHVLVAFEPDGQARRSFEALGAELRASMAEVQDVAESVAVGQPLSSVPAGLAVPVGAAAAASLGPAALPAVDLDGVDELDSAGQAIGEALNLNLSDEEAVMANLPPEIAALFAQDGANKKSELEKLLELKAEIQKNNEEISKILDETTLKDPELLQVLKSDPELADDATFLESAPVMIRDMMAGLESDMDDMIADEREFPTPPDVEEDPDAELAALAAAAPVAAQAGPAEFTREWVIQQHREGHSFRGLDLTGLDLSGLDLERADFQEAVLTSVNFSASRLVAAVFEDATIDAAVFDAAFMSEANLRSVSASAARFPGANLERASLRESDFTGSDFSGANLRLADLKESIFTQAVLVDVDASKVTADQVQLDQANCTQADFSMARLPRANFYGATLRRANLTEADCQRADFSGAQCQESRWVGADLSDSQADFQSSFDGAVLHAVNAPGLNWNKAQMNGVHFDKAMLDGADLTGCSLQGARLVAVQAKQLCLDRCDMTGADLSGINCFEGSMRNSNLRQAQLVGANLFGVDFLDAKLEGAVTEGSVLDRTLLAIRQS